jgi:FkbM family methyltransferase
MPQKITAVISETDFEQNFGFKETSGLFQDPNFRLVINKFGRCYWLLAHDNLQGPRFSGNNVYYQGNNSRLIRTIYPNARRIIDVGGNVGNNTIAYGEFAQKVESFEPTPTTLKMLRANIEIAIQQNLKGIYWQGTDEQGNLFRNEKADSGWYVHKGVSQPMNIVADITVHDVALSNTNTGSIDIIDHLDHGGHNHIVPNGAQVKLRESQQLVSVSKRTIDSYNFDEVDAIKIDVEGSELMVMQGAEQTIRKQRPSVQVEIVSKQCKKFGYEPQDLYDFFKDMDYTCVCSNRTHLSKQHKDLDLSFGKDLGMKHIEIGKYMDRLFVPREVHEATDYDALKQAHINPKAEELFDFG